MFLFSQHRVKASPRNMAIQIPKSFIQSDYQKSTNQDQQETNQIATKQKQEIPWMVDIPIPKSELFHQVYN